MRNQFKTVIILFVLVLSACTQERNVWVPGWQETASLNIARAGPAVVEENGFIYMIGGVDGRNFLKTTEYAKILEDGSLGEWKPTRSLNIERGFVEAVAHNGYIYIVGGGNGPYGQNLLDSAERAPILPDGSLGPWELEKFSMDTPRRCSKIVVWKNHIYSFGGYGGFMLNSVERAEILKDGSLGQWNLEPETMTIVRYINGVKAVNGTAYVIGGHDRTKGVGITNVELSKFIDGGGLNEWKNTSRLQKGRYALSTAHYKDYIYAMGGITGVEYLSTIEKAEIKSGGELSRWQSSTELSVPRANFSVVVYKDWIYILGGVNNDRYLTNVEYATFDKNGDPGFFGARADETAYKEKLKAQAEAEKAPLPNEGVVKEILHTSMYSYIKVTGAGGTIWLAAPKIDLKVNDRIRFPAGVNMTNFRSNELQRNFPEVVFVGKVQKVGAAGRLQPSPQPKPQPQASPLWKKQTSPRVKPQARPQARPQGNVGIVKEVLQTSLYTYIFVTNGNQKAWLAAPKLELNVNDKILFPGGATMSNFHSKELNRTFPVVLFVSKVQKIE